MYQFGWRDGGGNEGRKERKHGRVYGEGNEVDSLVEEEAEGVRGVSQTKHLCSAIDADILLALYSQKPPVSTRSDEHMPL